jgi:hypothetical protein
MLWKVVLFRMLASSKSLFSISEEKIKPPPQKDSDPPPCFAEPSCNIIAVVSNDDLATCTGIFLVSFQWTICAHCKFVWNLWLHDFEKVPTSALFPIRLGQELETYRLIRSCHSRSSCAVSFLCRSFDGGQAGHLTKNISYSMP